MIRQGTRADIPALIAVDISAGDLFAGTHMAWAVGHHTSRAEFEAAMERRDLWVSDVDGRAAGFLIGDAMDGDFYIDQISVHRAYQRRGLGRDLIDAALSEAKARRHRAATLTTDRAIPWNAPYYARLGFRVLAEDEIPPQLGARLAAQPNPHLRCAMMRDL